MTTWLEDKNGNKCSVEYFGTKDAAQKALDSLINCTGCINCSRCSDCSDCSDCSGCSDCSDCSGCLDCSDCSGCLDCSDCSGCLDCLDCLRCSLCSLCSRCSRCSDCSDCSGCLDCSDCSGCSRCSRCSDCSDKLQAVPVVENIHTKVYNAAKQDGALNMGNWHQCKTTHCRAGWVVTLAGEEGKKLEDFFNTELAAMLIYSESSEYKVSPVRFYDSEEEALADMKRMAELEN